MNNLKVMTVAFALMFSAGVAVAQSNYNSGSMTKTQNNILPEYSGNMDDTNSDNMNTDDGMYTGSIDAIPDSIDGYCDDLGNRKAATSVEECRKIQEQSDAQDGNNNGANGNNGANTN